MRRGKEDAQTGHGFTNWLLMEAIRSYKTQTPFQFNPTEIEWWENQRVTKIVLQAESQEQLEEVYRLAQEAGLQNVHIVVDSGLTEFHGVPTKTVVSIGPDWSEAIDEITGPEGKIPLKPR